MSQRTQRRTAYRHAGISSDVPNWVPTGSTGQPERKITATTIGCWERKAKDDAETRRRLTVFWETGVQPMDQPDE